MRKEQIITTNTNQMEEKGMKNRFIHFKKRFVPALSGALMGVMLMSTTCFAAGTGTSAVTQPLENLKTLIIAVIGAVGGIILAKNVMEFAQAYQQQDSSTIRWMLMEFGVSRKYGTPFFCRHKYCFQYTAIAGIMESDI